jgi:hypothetical protein
MHACEGYSGPNGEAFCPGMARKYLVTEMMGAVPTTPPFTMYLCSDCRLHAEWLYGRPSEDELAYWWHMERCDMVTLEQARLWKLAATYVFIPGPGLIQVLTDYVEARLAH